MLELSNQVASSSSNEDFGDVIWEVAVPEQS